MNTFIHKISKIASATLIASAVVGFSALTSMTHFVGNAQSAPTMEYTLGANKTKVTAGEEFQYTITVNNAGTDELNDILADIDLSPKVTYVAGSSTAEKGTTTVAFADSWIADTANLGTLTTGQRVLLRFTVKTNSDVTPGELITSTVQVKSNQYPDWTSKNFGVEIASADERAQLQGGNFMKVANITKGGNGWQNEEVSADPGNVIEYLVQIKNTGEFPARNVKIKANLPGQSQMSSNLQPSVTISSDNADSINDNVKVNVSSQSFLEIRTGHAKIGGSTDLFDCPNECDFPESLYHTAVNMGTVEPGEMIQIKFKSDLIHFEKPEEEKKYDKERSCFEARVFEDLNGNGRYDAGEPGLTWELDWKRDGDQLWTEYVTHSDKDGMGGRVCQDDEPDITTRLKVKDWCKPTTSTEQKGKLEFNKTKYFEFGCTRNKPAPQKTTTPKQLPKTGSAGEILIGVSAGFTTIGAALTLVRRRLMNN